METVRITRILFLPVYRKVADSGKVKCSLCGGVFERQVTAFSPSVSRAGLKPALVTVMLLMVGADEGEPNAAMDGFFRIVSDVTGEEADPEALRLEARRLQGGKDVLGDQLRAIAPYLSNAEKRMILESALRVAYADGDVSENEEALMRLIAKHLEVPDSIYSRVTGGGQGDGMTSVVQGG